MNYKNLKEIYDTEKIEMAEQVIAADIMILLNEMDAHPNEPFKLYDFLDGVTTMKLILPYGDRYKLYIINEEAYKNEDDTSIFDRLYELCSIDSAIDKEVIAKTFARIYLFLYTKSKMMEQN